MGIDGELTHDLVIAACVVIYSYHWSLSVFNVCWLPWDDV